MTRQMLTAKLRSVLARDELVLGTGMASMVWVSDLNFGRCPAEWQLIYTASPGL